MNRVLSILVTLAWALWFGGMIALFLFVMRMFGASREIAAQAAPVLFDSFATYQLIVGMIACAAATLLTLLTRRTTHAVSSLLMITALGAALVINAWTHEMQRLDRTRVADISRFQTLHHNSTRVYTTSAVLLMLAGIGWTVTPTTRRVEETARA